jgi:hypothetical protein
MGWFTLGAGWFVLALLAMCFFVGADDPSEDEWK